MPFIRFERKHIAIKQSYMYFNKQEKFKLQYLLTFPETFASFFSHPEGRILAPWHHKSPNPTIRQEKTQITGVSME